MVHFSRDRQTDKQHSITRHIQDMDTHSTDRDTQTDKQRQGLCQTDSLVWNAHQRDLWVRDIGVGKVVNVAL